VLHAIRASVTDVSICGFFTFPTARSVVAQSCEFVTQSSCAHESPLTSRHVVNHKEDSPNTDAAAGLPAENDYPLETAQALPMTLRLG
jgi:hypothetical protein